MPAPADTEEMLKSTTRPARPEDEQTTEEQQQPAQQPEEQQPEQTTNPPAGNKLPAPITPLTRVRGALAAPEDEDQRHADAISNLETQRRQQWEQQMPFAPSGWMPAVRPDEQAAAVRQSDYTAQKQQRQQKNVDLEEQRQVNSQREAQFRATGQSFYRDPYGDLQPVIDTTGRPMYRPTGFETGENEKGETMMVRRNAYGKQEYKTPPITTSGDPADENLYYNLPDGELKPIGKIDDLKGHTNPTIAHAAAREFAHRHAAMWREAINGVESANGEIQGQIAQATADHEAIGTKAEDIQKQIDTLRADPHFNETTGGILGMGGKPSDAALQLQTKANQLQLQLETTQQQQADIAGQIAKGGELDVRAKQAKADLAIYKLKAGHDNAKNLADVRRAILDLQGKTDKNDPVLSEILKKQDEFAKGIQQATDFAKTLGPRGLSSGDAAERPLPGLPDQLQQEPFAMVAKGVKQVGPLSIDRIAQLYGDGKTGFKPSSLLAMNQRINDIEETIQGFAGQSLAPKSGQMIASLKEEQDYLKNLYANRLTQLPADQQRKVTEYIGSLKTTAMGAVLRDAGVNIVPAMAAAKAGKVGGLLGTKIGAMIPGLGETGIGEAGGAIIGGGISAILGYMLADKAQRALIKAAFPDQYDKLVDYAAKDWDQHPIAKTLGGAAGQAPAFGLSAVSTARGMLALGKIAARQEVTAAETASAKALAIKAGVATAQSVGFDLKENKSVDPARVLSAVAQMMILGGEEKAKGPSLGEMRAKAEAGRGGPAGRQMPEQAAFDEQQRMPAKEANAELVPKEGENQLGAGGPAKEASAADLKSRMEAIDKRLQSLKGKNGPAQAHAAAKKAGWSDQEFVDRFEKAFGKKNAPKAPPPDANFNQQGTEAPPPAAAAQGRTKPFEAEGQPKGAKPPPGAAQADQKPPGFVDVTTGKPMTEAEAMKPPGAEPPSAAPKTAPKPPTAPTPAPAGAAKAAPIVTPPPAEPAAAPKPQKTEMGDKTVDFLGKKHAVIEGHGPELSQWQIKDSESPTGSRTTHDVGEVMDAFSRMSADDFTKQSKADRPNKRGGSEHAKEMGEAAKGNTDLVARLDSHAKLAREASHTAMDAGDMDRALAEGAKAQMFREAHEFATQTGYYSKESIASRAAEAERVAQEKAKANATQTGEKPKGNIGEHQGIPQGTNIPANGAEVRKGQGEQAGGGGGAVQRPPEAKAQSPESIRAAIEEGNKSPEEDARIDAELAAKKVAAAEPPGPALELESQTPEQSAAEAKKTREAAAKKAESKPQKRTSDKVIDALKKAKMMPPGATLGASPFSVAYDGAIDLAIGAIKAGRAVADVVKMAQEHFKAKYPNASAEALEDLANDIKMAHSGVAASGAAAAGRMQKVRDRIANVAFNMGLGEKGKIYDEMAKSRDAADNQANLFGRQNARAIENDIVHAFGQKTDQKAARDALTFAVEAGGDSKALDAMAAKIGASKKAPEKWKQRALDSIAFAQAHMAEMKPMVDRYHRMTRDQVTAENAAGIDTIYRSNYVMHAQDIDNSLGHWFTGEGSRGDFSSFEKNRTHETFADSLAAGVNPKSLDALDLLQSRLMHGQRMINKGAWMEGLKGITDPLTKSPIAAEPTLKERANGSKYFDAPKGYTVEHVGRTAIAVMNGYEGIFHALTDPSRLGDDGFMKVVQQANAGGKSSNLLFDSFHFGRLAAWNAAMRANAGGVMGGGAEMPNPFSYKRGLNLLDNTPGEIVKQARLDGCSPEQIKQLIQTKVKLDMLTKEGMNVGQIADNLHQEVLRRLPVIGRFNKFLFDSFQRGIMSEIGTMEYDRQRGMKGNAGLSDQEVARKVAQEINTRFGNFGRQGQFKSKSAQDVMRLLVLAPQWNEGLLKSEGGAVVNAGKSAANLAMGKGLATSMLTRSVATMVLATFVGNQLLNQYTRGKWTWENPEEGIGAKLSAWIPDVIGKGPGFFLNPMGIGAEVTHLIMSKYEKTDSMRRSVGGFIRSRASAIGRPVATMLFGTNAMGQKIRPENLVKETVKAAVPLPIPAAPLYGSAKQAITGEPGQSFAGQFQKQLMSSGGVKLDQAPSQIQRIQNLATQFNLAHKVEEEGEFYVGHLHDLEHAIEMKQPSEAQSAIEDLLKKSTPKAVVADFLKYAKSPFTRSKKREEEFIKSLNPEQKQTMLAARRSRVQIRDSALNLLRLYFKTHPVAGRQEALDLMSKNR
jgi:hypothetical protein